MSNTPDLGFINAPRDRAAASRKSQKWVEKKLNEDKTKIIVFVGDRPAIDVSGEKLTIDFRPSVICGQEPTWPNPVLINLDEDQNAIFATQLPIEAENSIVSDDVKLIDLRSLAMQACLPDGQVGMLAHARSLLHWHEFHQFCANCGTKTINCDAGVRRHCPSCQREHFPRVDPVVIMLVQHQGKLLMGRGSNFKEGSFSALAGFLEPGETIEDATRRETFEETGVKVGKVEYLMSQPWPFPSTLMIGVLAQATSSEINLDEDEVAEARWFDLAEIEQMAHNTHPQDLTLPPPMTIAYQMIKKLYPEVVT